MASTFKPLPPDEVIGPDPEGIKKYITYRHNEKGQTVKTIRTVRVERRIIRVKKSVLERRKWAKFGDAAGDPPGPQSSTTTLGEDVKLILRFPGTGSEPEKKDQKEMPVQLIIKCRLCGEQGHMTLKCPKRATLQPSAKYRASHPPSPAPSTHSTLSTPSTSSTSSRPNRYVPPHLRNKGRAGARMDESDPTVNTTLRISNLPQEMQKSDVYDLCEPFGRLQKVFLATYDDTGYCRGFSYVTFNRRADAEKAMETLDRHGYCNMILSAEWAKPRKQR
jgi:translation initiation factor 3 subunit G